MVDNEKLTKLSRRKSVLSG